MKTISAHSLYRRVPGFRIDIDDLKRFYEQIVANSQSTPYHDNGTHYVGWALTSRDGSVDDGVRKLARTKENINSVRAGMAETPLCFGPAKQALDSLSQLGLKHFRARIMALRHEGTAMSFHRDADRPAWRVHIPIKTNSASVFEWKLEDGRIERFHMPADGSAWLVRVDVLHRAINESPDASERVHLIASVESLPNTISEDELEVPPRPTNDQSLGVDLSIVHSASVSSEEPTEKPAGAWPAAYLRNRNELLKLLPRNGVVCEVGVFRGDFSQRIYDITSPSKLHLIDPWIHQDLRLWDKTTTEQHFDHMRVVQSRFVQEISQRRVMLHQGFSVDILACFPSDYFDWIYLDGNHQYDTVRLELELCNTRVKRSGFILGHDYIKPELYPEERRSQFQVVQAVSDFCAVHPWRVVAQTPDQPPGSKQCPTFVLARMAI